MRPEGTRANGPESVRLFLWSVLFLLGWGFGFLGLLGLGGDGFEHGLLLFLWTVIDRSFRNVELASFEEEGVAFGEEPVKVGKKAFASLGGFFVVGWFAGDGFDEFGKLDAGILADEVEQLGWAVGNF